LKTKITTFIKEVIKSPNESVPATFLETQNILPSKIISTKEKNRIAEEQERRLIEAQKEAELLKRQLNLSLQELS